MEESRKRGREYSRNKGWKRGGREGGSTVETRDGRGEGSSYSRKEGWNREKKMESTVETRYGRVQGEDEGVQ
jgi:hypothetical protein